MLYTINLGNVEGCTHRQPDIVHLVTTVETICEAGRSFVFYNYNATLDFADCFNELSDLTEIDWAIFFEQPRIDDFCKYFHSVRHIAKYVRRMESRQAEFLVHETVPLTDLTEIGVYDDAKAKQVRSLLGNLEVPVRVRPGWYF